MAGRGGRRTRWWGAVIALLIGWFAVPGVARADAALPTDYRSQIVGVNPPTGTIEVAMVGGDNFFELRVRPGTEAVVLGYQNEQLLRFTPEGRVEFNERAPSWYLSQDRAGTTEVPAYADATLEPSWRALGTGGTYAWHDHRTHWMGGPPPAGAEPGDVVQTASVPLLVAGVPVNVTVQTSLLARPGPETLTAGLLVGVMLVAAAVYLRRRMTWPVLVAALAATALGWWQFSSLPASTAPRPVWWILPAFAAVGALGAVILGHRLTASGLLIAAAVTLGVWVFLRRDGLVRAYIPTDAPQWLDRGVTTAAGVTAIAGVVGGLITLYRSSTV